MTTTEAGLTLVGRQQDVSLSPDQDALIARLRNAANSRHGVPDQEGVELPAPAELEAYTTSLQTDPVAATLLNGGWRLAVVDLRRVCAAQPVVHVEHAADRTATADPGDMVSLAAIALPINAPVQLPVSFDHLQKAWIFRSPNPNLRITSAGTAAANGGMLFGFTVALLPSFVRVARYQGRYVLVDGYHRSFGFLTRGIERIPALVADVRSFEQLGLPPVGMLPQEAYLGDRPPVLPDYLDENLSAEVMLPVTEKVVVLASLEFQTAG